MEKAKIIKISQFPTQPYNLCELLRTFQIMAFSMDIVWSYIDTNELNVSMSVSKELEGTLCAWLSSHEFQFESVEEEEEETYSRRYVLKVNQNVTLSDDDDWCDLTQTELYVLLTGLLKIDGGTLKISIQNKNPQKTYRASVIIKTNSDYRPNEFKFAYGELFELIPENVGQSWFDFHESLHGQILSLPFIGDSANALVCGFGEARQAVSHRQENDVMVGEIFNDVLHRRLTLTSENLKSSTAIFGSPGYGKSTLVNSLLDQTSRQGIGFVVIEPAKEEYRELKRNIPALQVFSNMQRYNPLLPPMGMDSSMYAEVVLQLIDLATETPRDSPLRDYFRETYLRCLTKKNVRPSFVIETYLKLMKEQDFTARANDFVVSGRHRLQSFFTFFCGSDYKDKKLVPFSLSRLLEDRIPVVIELNSVPTPGMKTAFTYWILTHLKAFFQNRKSNTISHILVLEEAHNILGKTLHPALITDVTNIVAENRAKGQTTFIIEQSPSRIDQGATNLCGNTFSFRLTSQGDREYAASMLDIDGQKLNTLRKHCCLARTNSMYSAEYIHVEVEERLLQALDHSTLQNDKRKQ